jgi:hypothetical protein
MFTLFINASYTSSDTSGIFVNSIITNLQDTLFFSDFYLDLLINILAPN